MASLYADENFPFPTVEALRTLGHDVLTAVEDKRAGIKIADRFVLARATELGRAVLTYDRSDYRKLHLASAAHAGIVTCSEDHDFPGLARRIHDALTATPDLAGILIRIVKPNPPSTGG